MKNHFDENNLKRMIEEIKEADYIENVIFISCDLENCVNIRKLLPENDVQWITSKEITPELIKMLRDNKLNLDVNYQRLTAENIEMLHSNGIEVNCWTCNSKEEAEALVKCGIDFITTNILE